MVERIIEFCARNRALVLIVVAFAVIGSTVAMRHAKLDAIPDLSDPQVIVFSEWMGRSPTLVEDQVTYPIVSKLIGTPHVTDVRGFSMFGMSFCYVIFEEGTDIYWARSRVMEYLNGLRGTLPEGVSPTLGPDATGIGWVFQYALVDKSGKHGLDDLRTFQDFTLRYALGSVPGVAEVASVGGYQKQYQVTVDPNRLRAYGVSLNEVTEAIRQSNNDVGGRILEMSGREYYVRGRGYITSLAAIENVTVRTSGPAGTPILVKDVGSVRFGPDIRRGLLEWNGEGEAVGGIVVMRYGENALDVIGRVKKKIADLQIECLNPEKANNNPTPEAVERGLIGAAGFVKNIANMTIAWEELYRKHINQLPSDDQERCQRAGIRAPIVPGILPVTNLAQIQRIASLCGARLPHDFEAALNRAAGSTEDQFAVGVEFATRQVQSLVDRGVPGIHFYVLNKSPATAGVLKAVALPRP